MDLCIYHGGCPDGWASAYIVQRRWPGIKLYAAFHGQPPPDVTGKDVIMVDFSYPREILLSMNEAAHTLTVLDHHKTAQWIVHEPQIKNVFSLDHSGAALAWHFCFPISHAPWWVKYTEDRDLWRFALPKSREVNGYIMALPMTIDAWNLLDDVGVALAADLGVGIRMQIDHYARAVCELHQRGLFHGIPCAIVNAAYPNVSDVGHLLVHFAEVAIIYFTRTDGMMQFSVYTGEMLDASELAKMHGGGGHRGAAGFQLPLEEGRKVVDAITGAWQESFSFR